MAESPEDVGVRFEALVKDRDALRVEVTQLRQSLEELQAKHQTSLDAVREELQKTQAEKEHAEEQYQTLLGRVNTIKAQLGERLKADAVRRNLPPHTCMDLKLFIRKTLPKLVPGLINSKNKTQLSKNNNPSEPPRSRT